MSPDQATEKAKTILRDRGSELKKSYNASAVGLGLKMENGKLTNKTAVVFYVNKKKTPEELKKEGTPPVPPEIEGIPTDVVEVPGGFKPR